MELSDYEVSKVKDNFAHNPSDKQRILAKEWDLQTQMIGKEPFDGIARVNENIRNSVNRKYSVNYDERMHYLRKEHSIYEN